jgi:CO/xanthine dehydrogenase FAD-binding subunit
VTDLKYESPKTTEAAVALLADGGQMARVFAGGTDLLVQMHEEMIEPTLLVDIKNIQETREISFEPDFVRIGAAVTGAELSESDKLDRIKFKGGQRLQAIYVTHLLQLIAFQL